MTVIDPCDETNPSLADIARAVNQVHSCVDGLRSEHTAFRAEQTRENREARDKRHHLANAVTKLQGGMTKIEREVGGLKAAQEISDARVTKLAKAFGQEKLDPGEKPEKIKTIAGWRGWQAVTALFGSLSGIVLAYKIAAAFGPAAMHALHHALMTVQ